MVSAMICGKNEEKNLKKTFCTKVMVFNASIKNVDKTIGFDFARGMLTV